MQVEFCTSICAGPFSYLEGQRLTLPDPLPQPFRGWLREGIVRSVRSLDVETAIAPAAVEQAVARRQPQKRTRRQKTSAVSRADDWP